MADNDKKEHLYSAKTLLVGAIVLISILCFPFATHADTVRHFRVTFEGSGTYTYSDTSPPPENFYSNDSMNFNWNNVVETFISEDNADSPDTWGNLGFSSEPVVNVTGSLTYDGTDYNGHHNCSRSIAAAGWPRITVMKALGPGYQFVVAPFTDFSYQDPFCILDTGPFWSGDELTSAFELPPAALQQGRIVQYVSGKKQLTVCGDRCNSSVEWNGKVTFEKLAEYSAPSPPHPVGAYSFSYDPVNIPAFSFDPAMAKPIGLGPAADGGNTLDLSVNFSYPGSVDLYLALYAPSMSQDMLLIGPGPSIQPLAQGLIKWKENINRLVEETVFGNISVTALPAGTYSFYLLATPPNSTASYYLWNTQFTK